VPLAALSFVASLDLINKLAEACSRWTSAWLGSVQSSVDTTAPVRTAVTPAGFGASAFLRVHALTFAAVMAALALIDITCQGTMMPVRVSTMRRGVSIAV
jgi:hypothetical protein